MEVILKKDVENLGVAGRIIQVKPGYARNYLFPKDLAMPATAANIKHLEHEAKRQETKTAREKTHLEQLAKKYQSISITAEVQVGEDEKVFGAVTSQTIAELLVQKGIQIDRRDIVLSEPLKALGQYDVDIKLGHGVTAAIKVWVVQE